jgi:hypothetical protein
MPFSQRIDVAARRRDKLAALAEFYTEFLGIRCEEVRCEEVRCEEVRCEEVRCEEVRCEEIRCEEEASSESWEPWIEMPILLFHNTDDNVVDVELGRGLRESFAKLGFESEWMEYLRVGTGSMSHGPEGCSPVS